MGVFRLDPAGIDQDELELDMIDHGLQEMGESTGEKGEPQLVLRCEFARFRAPAGGARRPRRRRRCRPSTSTSAPQPTELPEAQAAEVLELIDLLEQDDDVQRVFHTLA